MFAAFGLFALVVVGPKYAVRQARIENKFENRQNALAWEGQQIESAEAVERAKLPEAGSERGLLIPLKPLAIGVGLLALVGCVALWLRMARRHRSPLADRRTDELDH